MGMRPSGTVVIVAINNGGSNVSQTFSIANGANFTSVTPWIASASLSLAQQCGLSLRDSVPSWKAYTLGFPLQANRGRQVSLRTHPWSGCPLREQ